MLPSAINTFEAFSEGKISLSLAIIILRKHGYTDEQARSYLGLTTGE